MLNRQRILPVIRLGTTRRCTTDISSFCKEHPHAVLSSRWIHLSPRILVQQQQQQQQQRQHFLLTSSMHTWQRERSSARRLSTNVKRKIQSKKRKTKTKSSSLLSSSSWSRSRSQSLLLQSSSSSSSSSSPTTDSVDADGLKLTHFCSYYLRKGKKWRDRVLEILNLPIDMSGNFYYDSIPSFVAALKRSPPEKLKRVSETLLTVGLHDPNVLDQYIKTAKWKDNSTAIEKSIQERRQQLDFVQAAQAKAQQDLQMYQEQYDALAQSPPDSTSIVWTMRKVKDAILGSNATSQKNIDNANNVQYVRDMLQLKTTNRTSMLERYQTTIDAIQGKLHKFQKSLDQVNATSSIIEYEKLKSVVNSARDPICYAFAEHVQRRHSQMLDRYHNLDSKTDLTRPHTWYLHARLGRRRIIFHGGPTNSGKTYTALQRLRTAKKGAYLAPLRLLAAEVYEQLTSQGVYCNLYTGQERREIAFATHSASTVEMASLEQDYDVIVLDEIQMIADSERGFAWTRALLGSRCPEIHVCGGLEAVDLIRRLVKACGDTFDLTKYERFSELQVADHSLASRPDQLGAYKNDIQAGDCIVAFSRDDIFAIKREIEQSTMHKCCIIYGSLPPTTRSEQARRFNDPKSGYDVLVASDAIGMGLNLNIRRIIFNSIYKNDGSGIVKLGHSAVKQIAGRAGRRNSPFPIGVVTTRDPRDLSYLRECMSSEIKSIQKAGLLPTATHIETFSNALNVYSVDESPKGLHKVLVQFNDMASVKSDYFLCRQTPMVEIARVLADVDLPIADKYLFCLCPVQPKNTRSMQVMQQFARKQAAGEVAGIGHNLIPRQPRSLEDLSHLCHLFNSLELFLWLQKKFPPGNMIEQHTALARRDLSVELIGQGLVNSDKLEISHCYIRRDKNIRRELGISSNDVENSSDDEEEEGWEENSLVTRYL